MNITDILIARSLAGGGGGGGGDFSTMSVTLVNNTSDQYSIMIRGACLDGDAITYEYGFGDPESVNTVEFINYKGNGQYAVIPSPNATVNGTGDVSIFGAPPSDMTCRIYGDCTITISDPK